MPLPIKGRRLILAALSGLVLTGCGQMLSSSKSAPAQTARTFDAKTVDCMERAMFFESHRSSRDGLVGVGTVVMNRVGSPDFPNTVCGVVSQRNQFAPGVMTRAMTSSAMPRVQEAARAVLAGERHPMVERARFFHTAGHSFPYNNMHYVVTAGGNSFYEKRRSHLVTQPTPLRATEGLTGT